MNSVFLPLAVTQPGVYYAFQNSDSVGKGIVLLLLVISVFTWTVMIDKAMSVGRAKKLSRRFVGRFRTHTAGLTSPTLIRDSAGDCGPIGSIYAAGVERLLEFQDSSDSVGSVVNSAAWNTKNSGVKLSDAQLNAIEAVLDREVSNQIEGLETRIGMLATMVSLSPFLGLFGTVWGVMMAFCGIAAAGKSDFSALAPGVAGALLTTVAGLVVAIPSLVGYNLLTGTIRQLTIAMDNFSEEFIVRVKLEQLELERNSKER